ncbi:MAG: glycosyltransferase family 4 protein [Chloroflexota bacterium]|nr:glycosyltransferase family 4 protein [Chloroflexota bacterium]
MVRVLIDASALPPLRGGVGRYVDELIAHLPLVGVEAAVVCQPRDADLYAASVGSRNVIVAPVWASSAARRLLWEQVGLPRVIRSRRPDVVHSPHYTMPLANSGRRGPKQVVTLHDATFFSDPRLHLAVKARFFTWWTRFSCRRADALLVPSRATKDELVRAVHADADRIMVIPHGVDHQRFRRPSGDEVRAARTWLGLPADATFIAFLGTIEPRKNVAGLVRAYVASCSSMLTPPTLVLAGEAGWDSEIDAAIAELPEHLRVVRPGFVPDDVLPGLLGGAQIVAYPSFGEGFGLPVLEAMACGATVLTTDRLSLPEVGGDAVAYAKSPDVADVAASLSGLLADPAARAALAVAAVTRAATFGWLQTAQGHRDVYESLVKPARGTDTHDAGAPPPGI